MHARYPPGAVCHGAERKCLNPSAIAANANAAAQHGTATIGLDGKCDRCHQRQKKCDHEACQENIENATASSTADVPDGGHSVPDGNWFVPGAEWQ